MNALNDSIVLIMQHNFNFHFIRWQDNFIFSLQGLQVTLLMPQEWFPQKQMFPYKLGYSVEK